MWIPCKEGCSCERCKPGVMRAVEMCTVPIAAPPPTYANFFQTDFVTLATNQPMPWNRMGQTAGITLDPDTVTIRVTQASVYYIDYHVSGNFSSGGTGNTTIATAIFVNDAEVNPIQTRYGADNIEQIEVSANQSQEEQLYLSQRIELFN